MTRNRIILLVVTLAVALFAIWGLTLGLERLMSPAPAPVAGAAAEDEPSSPAAVAHITATLYFGSADGRRLVAVQREVPFGEGPVEQGRQIITAQLQAQAPAPLVGTIPPGTQLRSFYVTEQGDAFVDLSADVTASHPGGSTAELFTVYTIVNAVTTNLPALKRVQILIDGREVDTLAGHVDLRRPLQPNLTLVSPGQESN